MFVTKLTVRRPDIPLITRRYQDLIPAVRPDIFENPDQHLHSAESDSMKSPGPTAPFTLCLKRTQTTHRWPTILNGTVLRLLSLARLRVTFPLKSQTRGSVPGKRG